MVPLDREQGVVYHTAARHLSLVRKELWEDLRRLSVARNRGGVKTAVPSATKEELEFLQAHRIIMCSDNDERLFARYVVNSMKYNTSQTGIFISFTNRCNFKCDYCYQSFRKSMAPSDLSPRRWKSLFAFTTQRVEEGGIRKLAVALFGGEPLLNLDVVGQACKDLKSLESKGCNVHITLITNGALLSPSVWSDLEPYIKFVQVTIDGSREVHDWSRPFSDGTGSYEVVLENVAALASQSPGRLALRVNVRSDTLPGVRALLANLCEMRIQSTLAAVGFQLIMPTQQQICAGISSSQNTHMASELADLYLTAAFMGFPVARGFELGPCMYATLSGLVCDERLYLYKCPALLYWRVAGRLDRQGRVKFNSSWYEAVTYEPCCALSCRYWPICYGGCRAMTGDSRHIQCQKPFFDAALEKLIKAYVIARHNVRLANDAD